MNYERIVRNIRRDPRLFADDAVKIGRVLMKAKSKMLAQRERKPQPVGPYSGLTRAELRATGTCETDWY